MARKQKEVKENPQQQAPEAAEGGPRSVKLQAQRTFQYNSRIIREGVILTVDAKLYEAEKAKGKKSSGAYLSGLVQHCEVL